MVFPSLVEFLILERQLFKKLHLSHRPGTAALPTYKVQDIRGLRLEGGLSQPLINAIDNHLKKNSQVLIFVNRRGYSRTLFCTHCGWQASCSDCDANLNIATWNVEGLSDDKMFCIIRCMLHRNIDIICLTETRSRWRLVQLYFVYSRLKNIY